MGLINGFRKELEGRSEALKNARLELEGLYAQRVEDSKIDLPDNHRFKEDCMKALRSCDSAFTSYGGTLRSIKGVLETFQKSITVISHGNMRSHSYRLFIL